MWLTRILSVVKLSQPRMEGHGMMADSCNTSLVVHCFNPLQTLYSCFVRRCRRCNYQKPCCISSNSQLGVACHAIHGRPGLWGCLWEYGNPSTNGPLQDLHLGIAVVSMPGYASGELSDTPPRPSSGTVAGCQSR